MISEVEIRALCDTARKVFMSQPVFLELDAPINVNSLTRVDCSHSTSRVQICGDVHGQYADLLRIFNRARFPPLSNYLFLGIV